MPPASQGETSNISVGEKYSLSKSDSNVVGQLIRLIPSQWVQPKAYYEIHIPSVFLQVSIEFTYHCHAGSEFTSSQIANTRDS
jgi:hypothetical protein